MKGESYMSESTVIKQKDNKFDLKKFANKYGIMVILLLMVMGMSLLTPAFYNPRNLINIVRQVSVIGTIAFGVTLIIITGGIDLSSGSTLALVGVVVANYASPEGSVFLAIILGILVGAICGFINGGTLATTGIPPFIATLGMFTAARGVALLYSGGRPISNLSESFLVIGGDSIGFVPIPVILFLTMGCLTHVILKKTKLGKYIYAIGGNEQAAMVCGIDVKKVKIAIYTYAGIMSAVAGIILTSRVSSGNPTAGIGYELDAIASTVIGGTSLNGGIGTIGGTIVGALIIGVLNNGLSLLGVSPYWQQVIKGGIIVGAVVLDAYKHKKK
jgi:inositol transport system permease protein